MNMIIYDKQTLQEAFEDYDGENLSKEFIWDEDKGKEVLTKE